MENSKNIIRFKSCFICEVNIDDKKVELIDSVKQHFYIDKDNDELMLTFKEWFTSIYKACIPQQLTLIQYEIMHVNEHEPAMVVKKMLWNKLANAASGKDA